MLNKNQIELYQEGYLGIVTQKETINKNYVETVLWMEDGKKFPYRLQEVLSDFTGEMRTEIMPKSSRKIVHILNKLEVKPYCLPEDQKPNRKTMILTIKLNEEQKKQLEYYKSICK